MPKGMFTQGVCLLTDGWTTIEDIKSALQEHEFQIVKQIPAQKDWCFGGPTVIIPFAPDVNGYAAVDVVQHSWPDSMGDPKSDPVVFGAWSMGQFGPFAYPGGLGRARQHAWAWPAGRTVPEQHRGFIRIRISYVFGAGGHAPVMPRDYDPLGEMVFLSRAVLALFNARGVLCYFNPNGEVLYDRAGFQGIWDAAGTEGKIPLPLWMNVRLFHLNEQFGFMDTVGNSQLDISDVEAFYPQEMYDPRDIDYYLRNVTHYLLDGQARIHTGEAIDGPGETQLSWTTEVLENGIASPPRPVLRLCLRANQEAIRDALAAQSR